MSTAMQVKRILWVSVVAVSWGVPVSAADYVQWQQHRDAVRKDPSVLRYYTFEEKRGDTVANAVAAGGLGNLTVGTNPHYIESHPLRKPEDFPVWTSGRWPEKGALGFGAAPKSSYNSRFYAARDNHFSASMWVRVPRESGDKALVELCYVEDTITSGWKVTTGPGFTAFQISRPPGKEAGQGSVAVYGPALTPYVWHHVVAVLDGKTISLYVDGKPAKSREFDGIYTQPKKSDLFEKRPELDTAGLVLGNRTDITAALRGNPAKPLFELDEFALYGRALSADEVAAEYNAGAPNEPVETQITQAKKEYARRAAINAVTLAVPTDTFGYFTVNKPFAASVQVPVSPEIQGPLRATCTLKTYSVANTEESVLATQTREITPGAPTVTVPFTLPRTGLYSLDVVLRDAAGVSLREERFPIAGIIPLPPTASIPLTSPLAGHDIVNSHPAETMLGGRYDRAIAPFLRILPDGSYDWTIPDARIAADLKAGLEPLYTIYPPFNMPKSSPHELAQDTERWSAWVKTLVGHFKGKVRYWEVWNEPNAHGGFTAKDYVTLLKTAYTAIKEIDPEAKVVGGSGVYTIAEWTEAVLAGGGGKYMDILSIHNYVGTSPITYRNRYQKVRQVQTLLKKYLGQPIPVWNSEGGIHQPARVGGRPLSDEAMLRMYGSRANKDDGWPVAGVHAIMMTTEHRSACWNVQSILMDLADGDEKYFTLMGAGTFYPFKTSSEGLPTEKGVSYAALASVLSTSKAIEWLPLSNSRAAAVLVTDQNGRRTAVLWSDQPLEFTFNASEGQKFGGTDFLGNPMQWIAGDGGLTLRTADEPIYLTNLPAVFGEQRLITSSAFPALLPPQQSVSSTLEISNPRKAPLEATLEGTSPAGKVTLASKISIPARGKVQVPFQFETDATSRGPRLIQFNLKAEGKTVSQLEIPFHAEGPAVPIKAVTGAPNWAQIAPIRANQASNVVIGKPDVGFDNTNTWQGPEDCAFSVQTAWRPNDGIYVRLEVQDDKLYPTPAGNSQPWLWDGLELFVDVRPSGQRTAAPSLGAQQITVVPSVGATDAPCLVNNLAGTNATVDVTFTGKRSEKGYVLEGKISPKAGSGWTLKSGTRLGLDFAIDDNDNGVKRKTQLVLHGTASNSIDTSKWGEYQLAD